MKDFHQGDAVLQSPAFIDFAAGNEMIPNSIMLSHRYGGHQVKFHRSHCFYLGSYSCKLIKQAVNERIQEQSNKLEIYYFTGASVGWIDSFLSLAIGQVS